MKPTVKSIEINGAVFEFPDYAEQLDRKLDKSELSNAITVALGEAWLSGRFKGKQGEKGEQGIQGKPGENGQDGKDGANGISATHSWNGTTLTITSASGTSSSDLKGERGEKGEQGESGLQGAQGEKGDKGDTQKVLLSYNKDMKRLSISEVLLDAKNLDTKRY